MLINKKNKDAYFYLLIIFIFMLSTILRIIISYYDKKMLVYGDELYYIDIARNIALNKTILVHNVDSGFKNILYPLLISPFFLIADLSKRYIYITIFNCILMSSVIIPTFLLTKDIIKDKVKTIIVIILITTLPDLCFSATFMSEISFYPLSIWTIFFIWKFIISKSNNKKLFLAFLIGTMSFFCYLNKMSSLYIPIAFIILMITNVIIYKENFKNNIKYFLLFTISFLILYTVFDKIFFLNSEVKSGYSGALSISSILEPYNFIYFFYGLFFNISMTIFAFFYFPIMIPILKFKDFNIENKKFLIFIWLSLLIGILEITFTITVKENLGSISPRQHLRYLSPLLIPFLVCFFNIIENKKSKVENDFMQLIKIYTFTIFLCTFLFFTMNYITYGTTVDGVLLNFYKKIVTDDRHTVTSGLGEFKLNINVLIIKIALVSVILLGTYMCYFRKNKKVFYNISIFSILTVNLLNNYATIENFKTEYTISKSKVDEIIKLNNFLKNIDGNLVLITEGFNNIFDFYIDKNNYDISKNEIILKLDENKFIDLGKDKLFANYPNKLYEDLTKINYIVTDKSIDFDQKYTEKLEIEGITSYDIYINKDENKLYPIDKFIFPKKVNSKSIIYANENIFSTQHEIKNEYYISSNNSGALIFGPYTEIKEGVYNIKINYEYVGLLPDKTVVGVADVNLSDIPKVIITKEIVAGDNNIEINNIVVDIPSNRAEIRIHTDKEGLKFYNLEIKKIQ